MTLRTLFGLGPSPADRLFALLERDRRLTAARDAQQQAMFLKVIDTLASQSGVFQQWLQGVMAANTKPEAKVMTDADEAKYEQVREAAKRLAAGPALAELGIIPASPASVNFDQLFAELKSDLTQ